MAMSGYGNAFSSFGGLSTSNFGNGISLGIPGSINIPGFSAELNNWLSSLSGAYGRLQQSQRADQQALQGLIMKDYDAAAASQAAKDNTAINNLYTTLANTKGTDDSFLGSQVASLSQSGLDPTIVSAYAAAGAKSGVGNYETLLARANKALAMQQQFLDNATASASAGDGTLQGMFSNVLSRDLNSAYGTALRDTVGDLVGQLTTVQKLRQEYTNQTNALLGAAALQKTTETAKALMGVDELSKIPEQQANVQVADVSPNYKNTNQSGAALDSRGGGRYVTTAVGSGSGLRI